MKELFTLFFAGILCAGNINTDAADFVIHGDNLQIETPEDPPLQTMIILNGDLAYSAGPESIEASYSENSVQVCFHQSFGNVNITLTCDTGSVVYNNTVNTSVQRSIHIPLPCTPSGRYTLMINNANGYAEGDFVR